MWLEGTSSLLATPLGRNCSSFLLGHLVAISYLSRTYNVQVKIAVAWKIRIDDFSQKLLVPEDTILGTFARCPMRSLIAFSKHHMMPYGK